MDLEIQGSREIPHITFKNGVMKIKGRSIPHDSVPLYSPVLKSFFVYAQNPNQLTEIIIELEYLNSDSNRSLMNLLVMAEKMFKRGNNVIVRWLYKSDDEMMMDQGKIFSSLMDMPIDLVCQN